MAYETCYNTVLLFKKTGIQVLAYYDYKFILVYIIINQKLFSRSSSKTEEPHLSMRNGWHTSHG